MFTGDHVLPVITSHVGIRPGTVGSPLEEYISSLDKIADREVDMVCPAHEYVFNDLKGRIQALHRHHEARLEAVVGAIGDGSKTGYEIAEGVPWDVGSWEEMDIWLRRSALGETLSHLELLVSQGRVRRSQDVSPVRFEVART